jgi:hypothetical protein
LSVRRRSSSGSATPELATTSRSTRRSSAACPAPHLHCAPALAHQLIRPLEIAHDRVDVAADVAHLGELGGLDLEEGRAGEARQPARDLGLADPGGADHDDILGGDLVAQLGGQLLAPPAVAERHRDRALGGGLADDVAIELGHDLARGQGIRLHEPAPAR